MVQCETHGVFAYSKTECPGCVRDRPTYRQRQETEREALRAICRSDDVRNMLLALQQRYGVEHIIGSLGQTYRGVLLGAVDIGGKRYARLRRMPLGDRVVCVPWIDRFAEWLGEKIVVEWYVNEPEHADHFKVSERDGVIEAPKPAKPTLRELRATDADDAPPQT
jgi:hypothetical protein